jgi:hypothetical protein
MQTPNIFQPAALYQFTGEQMNRLIDSVVNTVETNLRQGIPKEIPTKTAKEILTNKGYRVSTTTALVHRLQKHGIHPIVKGKDYWFDAEQINNLPNKR